MAGKVVNKRKITKELTHHMDSKVRKTDNISSLTKQAIVIKYKELEEENRKLLLINENISETNQVLKERIAHLEQEISEKERNALPKLERNTQTEDLLQEAQYPCTMCIYVADCPEELCCHMSNVHGLGDPEFVYEYSCKICRKAFTSKNELM